MKPLKRGAVFAAITAMGMTLAVPGASAETVPLDTAQTQVIVVPVAIPAQQFSTGAIHLLGGDAKGGKTIPGQKVDLAGAKDIELTISLTTVGQLTAAVGAVHQQSVAGCGASEVQQSISLSALAQTAEAGTTVAGLVKLSYTPTTAAGTNDRVHQDLVELEPTTVPGAGSELFAVGPVTYCVNT